MREAIAHYKVLESLGSGGLGEVYRARDTNLGRTVAVKVLPPAITSVPEQVQSLLDTAARLVGLSHPNIAMLYEAGQEGEQRYLVFEFVQGEPLGTLIRDRPLNVRRVVDFAINLCDGSGRGARGGPHPRRHPAGHDPDYAKGPREVHELRAVALYWRIGARERRHPVPVARGAVWRSRRSPERYLLVGRGDFEMLTGRQRARGLSVRSLNPSVPAELEQVVSRMLASNPSSRSGSAAAIAAELRELASILDTQDRSLRSRIGCRCASPWRPAVAKRPGAARHRCSGRARSGRLLVVLAMLIESQAVPPFYKNGYVVACAATRRAVVIDPGDEVEQLLAFVDRSRLDVQSILLTHAHVDHVTGVARAKAALDVPIYLHADDQPLYDAAPAQAAFFGLTCDALPPIDRRYDLASTLALGDTRLRSVTPPATAREACAWPSDLSGHRRKIYSLEIRCLQDRSAVRISPAAIIPL